MPGGNRPVRLLVSNRVRVPVNLKAQPEFQANDMAIDCGVLSQPARTISNHFSTMIPETANRQNLLIWLTRLLNLKPGIFQRTLSAVEKQGMSTHRFNRDWGNAFLQTNPPSSPAL